MAVGTTLPVSGQVPVIGDIVMVVIYSGTGMDTASNLCISGFPGSTVIVHMDTSYIWTFLSPLSVPVA